MAGWTTNGVQVVAPITVNGTLTPAATVNFNSTTISMGAAPPETQLQSSALTSFDIQSGGGAQPTTAAATAFQISAHAAALSVNTATSTVHAATLNTVSGMVTTEALTTAAGSAYTFTLTNSLFVAGAAAPTVAMVDGTNTAGAVQLTSVTNATGSSVFVFTNTGSAAFNGTKLIAFHI